MTCSRSARVETFPWIVPGFNLTSSTWCGTIILSEVMSIFRTDEFYIIRVFAKPLTPCLAKSILWLVIFTV